MKPTRKPASQNAPRHRSVADTLGHTFRNPDLLRLALTHRSHTYETVPGSANDPSNDNEQLEFLGDAVLSLIVAQDLVERYPGSREGELTRLRASLVSRRSLAEVAARLDLGRLLRLGRGEESSGGRAKPALLADGVEAVIAAIYLDAGLPAAQAFVARHLIEPALPSLELALQAGGTFSGAIGDHKSALQELLQARGVGQPSYILTDESGPDHCRRFRVEVRVSDGEGLSEPLSSAEGSSKKEAQQDAARLALEHLLANRSAAPPARQAAPSKPTEAGR